MIATIALFAALGGGYAMAFAGSGTLQKGALTNIPSSNTTVRSLTGIGSVQARCVSNETTIRFNNTSGEAIDLFSVESTVPEAGPDTRSSNFGVLDGGNQEFNPLDDFHFVWHVVPDDGTKAPQADITVSYLDTGSCTTSIVTVLALNTQQ